MAEEDTTAGDTSSKPDQEASTETAPAAADAIMADSAAQGAAVPEAAPATEAAAPAENPLWTACKASPWEFDCWMALVPSLERAGDAASIREGYEGIITGLVEGF